MISLKNTARVSSLLFSLLFGTLAEAWTKRAHKQITQSVWQTMPSPQQEFYTGLAQLIGPSLTFADLGDWADIERKTPLVELFKKVGEPVPKTLSEYADKPTSRWHYHNLPYYPSEQIKPCDFYNYGLLVERMDRLDEAIMAKPTQGQLAVLVALQLHFIQDAHQPLHSISKLDSACEHDRGGNLTCVKRLGNQCGLNLHQMWDIGFGVFDTVFDFPSPKVKPDFEPLSWLKETEDEANWIYNFASIPSKNYEARGRELVGQRVGAAQARLAAYLGRVYQNQTVKTGTMLQGK